MRHDGTLAGMVMLRIKGVHFSRAALRDQIGQAGARGVVEAAPVFAGADDLSGLEAGEALAGLVPDDGATVRIDDEGRHDQVLHQPDGEIQFAMILIFILISFDLSHCHATPRFHTGPYYALRSDRA